MSIVVRSVSPGGPENVVVESEPVPVPGPSEVLIRVRYCSVNYPDVLMTRGKYQLRLATPFVLGSEALGDVVSCGGDVKSARVGDKVLASTWYGAFTTHLLVDAEDFKSRPDAMKRVKDSPGPKTVLRTALSRIPKGLQDDRVAAMGFAYSAAYHALKDRARITRGQRLLVLGAAGGIGLAAIQLGHALGAQVVAAADTEEERSACHDEGATSIALSQLVTDEQRESAFGTFDVVLDLLGGQYTIPALKTLVPGGKLLVFGFLDGIPTVKTNDLLLRECEMIGAAWGSWASRHPTLQAANLRKLYQWLRCEVVTPRIMKEYPLSEASKALVDMESRSIIGKAILNAS